MTVYWDTLNYIFRSIPILRVFNREECSEYPYMITRISDERYIIKMENEKPFGMGVFIEYISV